MPYNYQLQLIQNLFAELRWKLFPRMIKPEEVSFLETHFPYYQRLNENHRKEFLQKLKRILSTKKFLPAGGLEEVTSEMEILIGATITMVTFGWKRLNLAHFHTILIYPNTYYNKANKVYHRGEVNPKFGLIVVSWRCFVDGLADQNDGVNLGVHEVAHALKLANQIDTDGEREFDPKAMEAYRKWVPLEMAKIMNGDSTFFRSSAGLNEHEFFAVALESFFERSEALKNYHPDLYQTLVLLLRQDPLVLSNQK